MVWGLGLRLGIGILDGKLGTGIWEKMGIGIEIGIQTENDIHLLLDLFDRLWGCWIKKIISQA